MRSSLIFAKDLTVGDRRVRRIEIRRADRANSLTMDFMNLLADEVRDAANQPVVLTARGANFCAGLDLHEFAVVLQKDGSPRRMLDVLLAVYEALIDHPAPTACVVNGAAVAGGVGLSAATDYIMATRGASFAIPRQIPLLPRIPAAMVHAKVPSLDVEHWIGYHASATDAHRDGLVDEISSLSDRARLPARWRVQSSVDFARRRAVRSAINSEFDHVISSASGRSAELISAIRAVLDR